MYDRNVNGKALEFQVSGKLWNRSLVMSDTATGTLWSHLLGKAMQGELEGTQLKTVPSVITSWADWKTLHPETTIMVLPQDRGQNYTTAFIDKTTGPEIGVGYIDGDVAKCYLGSMLKETPLVNDTVAGLPILLFYDVQTGGAWCFERTIEGDERKVLTFEPSGEQMFDMETKSTWDPKAGVAIDGSLKGTKLKPRVVIPTFIAAWRSFHSDSLVYKVAE